MRRPYWSRSARSARTTGRIGARPSPPVTSRTSRPRTCSIGQPRPYGPRRPTTAPGPSLPITSVTLPVKRIVWPMPGPSSGPLRDRDRHLADPGHVNHVELTWLNVIAALPLLVLKLERKRRHARGFRSDREHIGRMRTERVVASGRHARRSHRSGSGDRSGRGSHHAVVPPRMAATSSVMSIATGHHVMQRPQPTHPETPY